MGTAEVGTEVAGGSVELVWIGKAFSIPRVVDFISLGFRCPFCRQHENVYK